MRALPATVRTAMAEVAANPRDLVSKVVVMGVNDVVWIAFWVLFFRSVDRVGGWDGELILLLLAVITTTAGITLGFLSNARRIGAMAVDGDLDAVLTLPVPPLAYVLLRRIDATNVGDVAFGVTLFAFTGSPTVGRSAVFVGVVLAATTVLTSFLVLTGSLAFFLGRNEGSELGFHAMLLLGSYPTDVFAGVAKVVLFTVVPAAFISTVPARLVDDFDLGSALWLAGMAAGLALAAWTAFTLGLRRYTSGSLWSRA